MRLLSRLASNLAYMAASIALVAGLGACQDQGPERFDQPVSVELVPEMAAKFANVPYRFADGAFFEPRFAGAPMTLTYTSRNTFRAEGKGQVWTGTITYPARLQTAGASIMDAPAAPAAAVPEGPARFNNIYRNTLYWFGNANPESNPGPGVGFNTVFLNFSSPVLAAWQFNGIFSNSFVPPETFSFQACILGITTTVGPYGTVSASYNRGAC